MTMERRIDPTPPESWDEKTRELIEASSRAVGGAGEVFAVIAHHPRLLASWTRFAGSLLSRSLLDRRLVELVILRGAWNCGCDYEWGHHVPLARAYGVSEEEIAQAAGGGAAAGWSALESAALMATDELHRDGRIGAETWAALAAELAPAELVELCMLVGHYKMLSMLILSAGVQNEPGIERLPPRPPLEA
jgi:AhpD family alkylhydroperoxidase